MTKCGECMKAVEYERGWGWIARNPQTGEEIVKDFRWTSRSVARDVVRQSRAKSTPQGAEE